MKYYHFFVVSVYFLLIHSISSFGQSNFVNSEEELAYHADVMANASEGKHRSQAMSKFNSMFLETLGKKGSYQHQFDSLKWISKKSPIDRSFRIFTWEVAVAEGDVRYFGIIQTSDEKLHVLKDNFKNIDGGLREDEYDKETWLGALYYHLMENTTSKGEKYYLLFGINRWDKYENIKLIDVLFFTREGNPYFGKPVFRTQVAGQKDEQVNRLLFKYAADAQMTVNYNPGMEMIVVDNLIKKMSRIPGQGETLVPDGSYVGYELKEGYWTRIDKIATQIMDEAPRPKPVLDQRKGKKINGN
ncbi:MAG: hypothetical protein IPK35_01880 [Saprospiraceae bacterium]|jgi:hypothetical protein|nr:hypothetical protein [Saprospiraceae bacterium]